MSTVMEAVERGIPMLIEKPLATDLAESARVLAAIEATGVDAVVGYTQRFRRKWLSGKEKVTDRRARRRDARHLPCVHEPARGDRQLQANGRCLETISPMVISGTHALDIVMWYMEAKKPVEVYARSIDKVLGPT